MNFVLKNKKINVKYTLLTNNYKLDYINLGIFQNIEKKHIDNIGCPSTNSLKNRLYSVKAPISVDIKFNQNNYEYLFDTKIHKGNKHMHNLIKQSINLNNNDKGITSLQFLTPYLIITDSKDLEFSILEPNVYTKNVKYVSGSLMPYSWLRTINSAYVLNQNVSEGVIKYRQDKPMFDILFNKEINLEYVEPSEKIINYWYQCKDITLYTSNIQKHYKYIKTRRPKKLL